MKITVNEFKKHFERVSHERYEEDHGVVERAVGRAKKSEKMAESDRGK